MMKYMYYLHLTSVGFEYYLCNESHLTSFIMLFAWLVKRCLVHSYKELENVYHVPKCMGCNEAIGRLLITRRALEGVVCLFLTTYIYTVHHKSEYLGCHKAIGEMVIARRVHCLYFINKYIYIHNTHILYI